MENTEMMTNVATEAVETVENVVVEKANAGLQINNWEAAGIVGAAIALGFGIAKLIDFAKNKKAQKETGEKVEKAKKSIKDMFKKSKEAVEDVAEEVADSIQELTED